MKRASGRGSSAITSSILARARVSVKAKARPLTKTRRALVLLKGSRKVKK
jgi:hypothetical protein